MKKFSLVYCTNIWNHYQEPICNEFVRILGADWFKLCLFEALDDERRNLGWGSEVPAQSWIAGPPIDDIELKRLSEIVCKADVAILGQCPKSIRAARAATGRLTFIMSERIWKKPHYWWRMLNPRYARGVSEFKKLVNRENMNYLAIGSGAADDVRRIDAFGDRIWTWAYFADVSREPPKPKDNGKVQILWVGRMLKWKRVDLLIRAVSLIRGDENFGHLHLVGSGAERIRLIDLVQKLELSRDCTFHDAMSADSVRRLMRAVDIYVLPSNRYEGWGVVANEAMSEGAVLVANEEAGATRVLVEPGKTGFIFRDGDVVELAKILRSLISNRILRENVRQAAWKKVCQVWHPRTGAERLIDLCNWKLGWAPKPSYESGPGTRC